MTGNKTEVAFDPVTDITFPSVTQHLAALYAHQSETMPAADLQVNTDQRGLLDATADASKFVKVGDVVDSFSLEEVDGEVLTLEGITAPGPAVLIFFRTAGCPSCNIALPHYQRELLPGVLELGGTLVAVSPQQPTGLREIKERHNLQFPVATDRGNELARRFGITFVASEATQQASRARGADLGEITGTGTWELPMPTIVVIDQDRVVRFADVHPDWLVRTEAAPVLEVLKVLRAINEQTV
ncbi:MAG: alkyl hydroperoxide reductase [Acidimicrobiia bacterium]|nr:alkyl hydroperoxide reductase [Acidimicrobiia bacterium]